MKDIMKKLAELEATAPKASKKKMLNEDSTTPPINVSNKPASLKDMFEMLSENVAPGQKPLPVLDPQKKQAGMGFVTSDNPSVQNILKNLDPKDVQIVQAPGQQPMNQQQQTSQPAPAGATGQTMQQGQQQGQQLMREVDSPVKARYNVKPTKYSSTGKFMVRDLKDHSAVGVYQTEEEALAAAEKLNKEREHRLMRGRNDDRAPTNEGAKVDRMVKHIEKSEKKSGKSKEEAEDIAWATANKRGMLDNKNKKKVSETPVLGKGMSPDTMARDIEQSDREYIVQRQFKDAWKKKNPGKKWPGYSKAGFDDIKEADIPSTHSQDTMGAGLGAGRSQTTLEGKVGYPFGYPAKLQKGECKECGTIRGHEDDCSKHPDNKKIKEGKKPDFLDLDKDGNKKESMKKAAADKKKKKVDESMNHRISAARLEGKSHGLRGHAHSGKRYEDLEELKAYHEGYKEGLDESYGMGMYETAPAATVGGMASQAMPAMEDEMEEGNAFTAALAKTPKGGKFTVGGKTYTDHTSYDTKIDEYTFESLDNQLNALLNESQDLNEGLSVSVSKGQQNSPDSVTITAQDAEAEQLLQLVKHAGLGLFGDDHAEPSSAMSVQPSMGEPDEVGAGGVDVEVVDGNDGIMGLMQKLSGIQTAGADDYEDEEGGEEQLHGNHSDVGQKDCGCEGDCECDTNEETCNECGGMMEAGHSCGSKMAEDESEDQMEFEVSEDNAPDSDEAETSADEDAEAKEDAALAGEEEEEVNESFFDLLGRLNKLAESKEEDEDEDKWYDKNGKVDPKGAFDAGGHYYPERDVKEGADDSGEPEDLTEWANQTGKGPGKGTDASFEQDIDFMTKVIAGGLNKPKSTGQTTVPVITGQEDRMKNPKEAVTESINDWVKLAGIKKS
jgi:hypothetical protein